MTQYAYTTVAFNWYFFHTRNSSEKQSDESSSELLGQRAKMFFFLNTVLQNS